MEKDAVKKAAEGYNLFITGQYGTSKTFCCNFLKVFWWEKLTINNTTQQQPYVNTGNFWNRPMFVNLTKKKFEMNWNNG